MRPSETPEPRRPGIRETATNGRVGPVTLPARRPRVVEVGVPKVVEPRPTDARAAAGLAGPGTVVEVGRPTVVPGLGTVT